MRTIGMQVVRIQTPVVVDSGRVTRSVGRLAAMAKKKAGKKVNAVAAGTTTKPVRLDLSMADHERLERFASELGLTKAAYSRMVVLERLKEEEEKRRPKG